jgi:hypothetical protein
MKSLVAKIQAFLRGLFEQTEPDIDLPVPASWGWLPVICLLMALGALLLSIAGELSRTGSSLGIPLYWIALILIFAPSAVRFTSSDVSLAEGVGLIIILSIGTYLPSYLQSPITFRGFDEFLHWRTVYDILQTHTLFTPNSMLPVSPYYPGLENVTAALVSLTGMDIIATGAILLLTARLIMLLGLFLLFEHLSGSVRIAGIGTLVYLGSSTFLYFDAQFGYESLALPLAIMVVFMLYIRGEHEKKWRPGWNILILITTFGVVATHHATTYMLITFILVWACIDIFFHLKHGVTNNPIMMGFLAFLMAAAWTATVAKLTIGYLTPFINDSLNSIYGVLAGTTQSRQLFVDSAGRSAISLDKIFALASVLVLMAGLVAGLLYWWTHYRKNPFATALVLVAIIYPALPVMRLSGGSWEMANRLSGFVFAGLAFIVALGFLRMPVNIGWLKRSRQWLVVAGLTIAFMGGVVAGASPDARLPQPYRAAAGTRSIENQGILTADWARAVLGANNRIAGDRTMTNLLGSYGAQRMISDLNDHVSISGIFVNYDLTPSNRQIIKDVDIRYLVVDTRITQAVSTLGYYFESWEQLIFPFAPPINRFALEKFDYIPGVSRIYDSGDIYLYDVGGIKNAP